jgi:hypothetical protein
MLQPLSISETAVKMRRFSIWGESVSAYDDGLSIATEIIARELQTDVWRFKSALPPRRLRG